MNRHNHGWPVYIFYLTRATPLTEQQAKILAARNDITTDEISKTLDTEEISETLDISEETVKNHWEEVIDQWHKAKTLCSIMGPHPYGANETREPDNPDDIPWNRLASGALNHADDARTRTELELYCGNRDTSGYSYLLIEREIKDTTDWATRTTEDRSVHGSNALRQYIYADVETIDEYFLRWALLDRAGIDPGADYARPVEAVVDRDLTQDEIENARERAFDRVEGHTISGGPYFAQNPS
jgi:DNA-binding CsgD family transcriptional regulator